MRIVQIMLERGFGGAQRSFVDTTLALAARGHQVQAIYRRDFVKQDLLEATENIRLDSIKLGDEPAFVSAIRITRLLRKFRADIIHSQQTPAALHGGRAGKLVRVPVVSKLHNYVRLEEYRHVHTLIGTTEDQRRHALAKGWPADRVTVVPNFSRLRPVDSARSPARRPIRLLAYGRYVDKKADRAFKLRSHSVTGYGRYGKSRGGESEDGP